MKLDFFGFADSSHLVAVINSALGILACQRLAQRKENAFEKLGRLGWISRNINDRETIQTPGARGF